jgi:transposase
VYRAAQLGGKPTLAVEEHFVVSKSTAAKWVARCRRLGLLPPTLRGVVPLPSKIAKRKDRKSRKGSR